MALKLRELVVVVARDNMVGCVKVVKEEEAVEGREERVENE